MSDGRTSPAESRVVRELLLGHSDFRKLLGGACDTLRARRIDMGGQTSERFQLSWRDGGRRLGFAKRYPIGTHVDVLVEFDAPSRLSSRFQTHAELRAPRPLAAIPEHRLIVLDWVEGTPLARLLFRGVLRAPGTGLARAAGLVGRAATMLGALQRMPIDRPDCGTVVERYVADCDRRLGRMRRAGFSASMTERIRDTALPALRTIESRDVVFQHSDFGPTNLLVDNTGRLWVIDLHNATAGHYAYDTTFFLTALEVLRRYRAVSGHRVDRICAEFSLRTHEMRRCADDGSAVPMRDRTTDYHARDPIAQSLVLMHMAYFAGFPPSRRTDIWLPRPLAKFAHEWLESTLGHAAR